MSFRFLKKLLKTPIFCLTLISCASGCQKKETKKSIHQNSYENFSKATKTTLCKNSENPIDSLFLGALNLLITNLENEKDLFPVGLMNQSFYEGLKIHEAFRYFHQTNIDTARDLMIFVINKFVDTHKNEKNLSPYPTVVSFLENLELEIFIEIGDKTLSYLPKMNEPALLSFKNGQLLVQSCDPMELHIMHEENYTKSINMLSKNNP